ncbi:MAG: protein phosphatase 2C domain-containing protein [Propionibacteriaceae bacterium]|nr:protein phosphatase 2C domain-containing protein [Propionibacteriaceae bacterium]
MSGTVRVDSASGTDVGKQRTLNEDAVLDHCPVFIVADGMGGHEAGEIASAIVVEEMSVISQGQPTLDGVGDALHRAKLRIDELSARGAKRPAGTTVSGVVMVMLDGDPYWLVVNLGDSRTYHVARGEVSQVSVDHSEVQEMIDAGRLDAGQAHTYDRRNVITRVLGAGTPERPDYWLLPVADHDRWLVCSDGLTAEVPDDVIARTLVSEDTPQAIVDSLISASLMAGGHDNVSVIVVDAWRNGADAVVETTVELAGQDDYEHTIKYLPTEGAGS